MAQFVTDALLTRLLVLTQAGLTHIGVQNGSEVTESATQLNGEFARKEIIDSLVEGNTLIAEAYFSETEGNGTITGFGIFGNGATNALNSGTLMATTSALFDKTTDESLTLSAEITLRRTTT